MKLMDLCLETDPAQRPTARELMRWVNNEHKQVMARKSNREKEATARDQLLASVVEATA